MRIGIKVTLFLLSVMAALSSAQLAANAQPAAPAPQFPAEIAFDYSFLRSNAPPGGCGCFNLNGGSATFAWLLHQGRFALVGDATLAQASSISADNLNLTLGSYTAGIRYRPRLNRSSLQPFGQVLIGVAHTGGSLVHGPASSVSNAGASFASNIGGGVDLRLTPRIAIRLAEADYLLTTFKNGDNDHQNNLRLSAGLVFHF
jgi:peptidoglycan-associated lipoprotein